MGYAVVRGRKPFERASKISHAEIINSTEVQAYLEDCSVPEPANPSVIADFVVAIPPPANPGVQTIVAVDGGFTETPVREEFPSASITFFTLGPLLFKLSDLRELDDQPFIAPEDLAKLKNLERYTIVLPTRNISRRNRTLQLSVRETLYEFFSQKLGDGPALIDAFRWLIFSGWFTGGGKAWELPRCPNLGCSREKIELTPSSPDEQTCSSCGKPIFLVDALRLHERVDEEQGAGGILSYVMTSLEQLILVHVIKALWDMNPQVLREVMFIKDGPLAFFGQTAPLSRPMRELAAFLADQPDPSGEPGARTSFLNAVGLEKSGAFVEHAIQIEDRLAPETALILTNDYIYRYIVPGDPASPDPYGKNTYWGGKLIYKAADGNVYVMTVPTGGFKPTPTFGDFPNLSEICSVVGSLRCSMYDNALIPIALVNKLVSLSDFPSARILETFAKSKIG